MRRGACRASAGSNIQGAAARPHGAEGRYFAERGLRSGTHHGLRPHNRSYRMNQENMATYRANGEVVAIDISAFRADVKIVPCEGAEIYIKYPRRLAAEITEDNGKLTMRRRGGPLAEVLPANIELCVPGCTVPDMNVNVSKGRVEISDGIYGDVLVSGGKIHAVLFGATFENLTLKADKLDVCARDITVKNLANAMAADGRVEINGAFCKKAECRVKKGNIGLCDSACDFALLNSDEGNIAASMVGRESDYTVSLKGAAVSGRECHSSSGKSIKARAARGCVVFGFNKPAHEDEYGEVKA